MDVYRAVVQLPLPQELQDIMARMDQERRVAWEARTGEVSGSGPGDTGLAVFSESKHGEQPGTEPETEELVDHTTQKRPGPAATGMTPGATAATAPPSNHATLFPPHTDAPAGGGDIGSPRAAPQEDAYNETQNPSLALVMTQPDQRLTHSAMPAIDEEDDTEQLLLELRPLEELASASSTHERDVSEEKPESEEEEAEDPSVADLWFCAQINAVREELARVELKEVEEPGDTTEDAVPVYIAPEEEEIQYSTPRQPGLPANQPASVSFRSGRASGGLSPLSHTGPVPQMATGPDGEQRPSVARMQSDPALGRPPSRPSARRRSIPRLMLGHRSDGSKASLVSALEQELDPELPPGVGALSGLMRTPRGPSIESNPSFRLDPRTPIMRPLSSRRQMLGAEVAALSSRSGGKEGQKPSADSTPRQSINACEAASRAAHLFAMLAQNSRKGSSTRDMLKSASDRMRSYTPLASPAFSPLPSPELTNLQERGAPRLSERTDDKAAAPVQPAASPLSTTSLVPGSHARRSPRASPRVKEEVPAPEEPSGGSSSSVAKQPKPQSARAQAPPGVVNPSPLPSELPKQETEAAASDRLIRDESGASPTSPFPAVPLKPKAILHPKPKPKPKPMPSNLQIDDSIEEMRPPPGCRFCTAKRRQAASEERGLFSFMFRRLTLKVSIELWPTPLLLRCTCVVMLGLLQENLRLIFYLRMKDSLLWLIESDYKYLHYRGWRRFIQVSIFLLIIALPLFLIQVSGGMLGLAVLMLLRAMSLLFWPGSKHFRRCSRPTVPGLGEV